MNTFIANIWGQVQEWSLQRKLVIFILCPLLLLSAFCTWLKPERKGPTGVFTTPPVLIASHTKIPLNIPYIKIIPKSAVKKKYPVLPPEIEPEEVEVVATADLPPSENGTEVISIFNTTDQEVSIITKEKPAPLFAFEDKKRVGVGYGYSTDGNTAKVYGEWSFLRVGNIHASVQGEISTTAVQGPEAKSMLTIDYRW